MKWHRATILVQNIVESIEESMQLLTDSQKEDLYYLLFNEFEKFTWKDLDDSGNWDCMDVSNLTPATSEAAFRLHPYLFDEE